MESKRRVCVFLDQPDIDVLKLDALLSKSTVSARLRVVIKRHCEVLALGQPRSLFAQPPTPEPVQ
jgi:hypothetical protein